MCPHTPTLTHTHILTHPWLTSSSVLTGTNDPIPVVLSGPASDGLQLISWLMYWSLGGGERGPSSLWPYHRSIQIERYKSTAPRPLTHFLESEVRRREKTETKRERETHTHTCLSGIKKRFPYLLSSFTKKQTLFWTCIQKYMDTETYHLHAILIHNTLHPWNCWTFAQCWGQGSV